MAAGCRCGVSATAVIAHDRNSSPPEDLRLRDMPQIAPVAVPYFQTQGLVACRSRLYNLLRCEQQHSRHVSDTRCRPEGGVVLSWVTQPPAQPGQPQHARHGVAQNLAGLRSGGLGRSSSALQVTQDLRSVTLVSCYAICLPVLLAQPPPSLPYVLLSRPAVVAAEQRPCTISSTISTR